MTLMQCQSTDVKNTDPSCPNINMHILLNELHISHGTSWENLFKYQDIPSLVTISFILMTSMFSYAMIL